MQSCVKVTLFCQTENFLDTVMCSIFCFAQFFEDPDFENINESFTVPIVHKLIVNGFFAGKCRQW